MGQDEADALPRQGGLAHLSLGQTALEANLLVAVAFADDRLAIVIGLFDGLGLRKKGGGQ